MLEREGIGCEPIVSSERLDALEKGLERLGKFDGYVLDRKRADAHAPVTISGFPFQSLSGLLVYALDTHSPGS